MGHKTQESIVIGFNLKAVREASHLTVGMVAHKSGVAERTIQRAEAGEPIREENLKALCDTLGIPQANIRIDWSNPPEDIKKALKAAETIVPLKAKRVQTAMDIESLGTHGMSIFHRDERLTPGALDMTVQIQEAIQDMGEVLMDADHAIRWEESKRIAALLEELENLGAALVVGNDTLHLKPTKFAPDPMPWGLLVCAYVPREHIPANIGYDRRTLGNMFAEAPFTQPEPAATH